MERLNLKDYKLPKKKKAPKYKWQELCLDLASKLGISKGLLFKSWIVGGYPLLYKIKGEIEERVIKNPKAYILWVIDNFKKNKN